MFTPQQLADLSVFNGMQAMNMAHLHGAVDAERARLAAELAAEQRRSAELAEQLETAKQSALELAVALRTRGAELAATQREVNDLHLGCEHLEGQVRELGGRPYSVKAEPAGMLSGGIALAAAEEAPAEPAHEPAPADQQWHVTGD